MKALPLAQGINITGGFYSSFVPSDESNQYWDKWKRDLERDILGRLGQGVEEVAKNLLWEAHVCPTLASFTKKMNHTIQANYTTGPILFWLFMTRNDKQFFAPSVFTCGG